MTVFLSGPMGSGKTTLARAFGGARVVDLDGVIETRHGASIAELFRNVGEPAFRAIERAIAREVIERAPDVVALGGGTVTDRALRRQMLRRGTLVTLMATPAVLAARIGASGSRPLLGADRAATLARLNAERADAYAECHAVIDTEHVETAALVSRIRQIDAARPLVMPLGVRTYPVHVGSGTIARARDEVLRVEPTSLVVVSDENTRLHAETVLRVVATLDLPTTDVVLASGEAHKTLAAVETIWDRAQQAGVDRRALVIAVGGGVVGDVAGFAAATLLRGVAFAQVPTSLLAMVDASVGGKAGVDRAQGKNLVGAFHQPRFVLADLDTLATLPTREHHCGLAEVVKAAWLEGEDDVAALERDASAIARRDVPALAAAVRRAITTKIGVVSDDEHETGARAHLNLGHTLGHAFEAASGYARTHGECVALGLVAAARIGVALGDATPGDVDRMTRLLASFGLPVDVDAALADPRVAGFLAADKKRDGARVRFVVPGAPGRVRIEPLEFARVLALARG